VGLSLTLVFGWVDPFKTCLKAFRSVFCEG